MDRSGRHASASVSGGGQELVGARDWREAPFTRRLAGPTCCPRESRLAQPLEWPGLYQSLHAEGFDANETTMARVPCRTAYCVLGSRAPYRALLPRVRSRRSPFLSSLHILHVRIPPQVRWA